jgi:hypothetical protein
MINFVIGSRSFRNLNPDPSPGRRREMEKTKDSCFLSPFSSQEKGGRGVEFPGLNDYLYQFYKLSERNSLIPHSGTSTPTLLLEGEGRWKKQSILLSFPPLFPREGGKGG